MFLLSSFGSIAQTASDNEETSKWELGGSISSQFRFYNASGINSRRQPFIWTISGAPIVKKGDFRMPILFTVGNLSGNGRQPFNKISLMPTYKSFKGYLGFNRVNFSKYTLQGRVFLGAGFEFYPGIFRLGAVYGRFNKAVEVSPNDLSYLKSNYSRWGYAVKIGLGTKNNYVDIIALQAKDDSSSLESKNPDEIILAEENTVISLSTKQVITKNIVFYGDVASSGYTRNIDSREAESSIIDSYPFIKPFFNPKYASSISLAYSARLDFNFQRFKISASYEHIDPEYRSFMAYFFTNDVERITASIKWPMLNRKMNVHFRGGLENNNVSSTKFARSKRFIAMANLNYIPNRKFSLSANYSSFSINQQIVRDVFSDSLKLAQVNQNASVLAIFNLYRTDFKHTITVRAGYQFLNEENELSPRSGNFSNANTRLLYAINFLSSDITVKAGATFNQFDYQYIPNSQRQRYGLDGGASKTFKNNTLLVGVKLAWYQIKRSGATQYNLLVPGIHGRYRVNTHHTFTLNAYWNNKMGAAADEVSFNEIQGFLTYRYSFK